MKIFLDSVRLPEIEAVTIRGIATGVTVNPNFLMDETPSRPLAHVRKIVELIRPAGAGLHVQVQTEDVGEMVRWTETVSEELQYPELVVKVPCGWDELAVVSELHRRGFAVNCTACMTPTQAALAMAAGADYVTIFYGKMSDVGIDSAAVLSEIAETIRRRQIPCQVLVASLRKVSDIRECMLNGADVVGPPFALLRSLAEHPKTKECVAAFAQGFMPLDVGSAPPETALPRSGAASRA